MGELDHDGCPVLMTRIREAPEPRNDLVLVNEDVVEGGRTVGRHRGRTRGHRHRNAAFRPLDMIGAVEILRHPILGVGRFVRSYDDPVAQPEVFKPIGLEKRVGRHWRLSEPVAMEAHIRLHETLASETTSPLF